LFDPEPPRLDGSVRRKQPDGAVCLISRKSGFNPSADFGTAANTTANAAPGGGVAPSPRLFNEPSDTTQVSDAIYRSQFGKSGSSYHVLLGNAVGTNVTITPTQSIMAPQNQGLVTHGSVSNADLGRIDVNWFSPRLKEVMGQLHTDPTSLVLFATYDIVLYTGNNPANCCIIGYHSAFSPVGLGSGGTNGNGNQPLQTFMFASWTELGSSGRPSSRTSMRSAMRSWSGMTIRLCTTSFNRGRSPARCNTAAPTSWRPATRRGSRLRGHDRWGELSPGGRGLLLLVRAPEPLDLLVRHPHGARLHLSQQL
jgi:hypothetical protein